MEVMAVVGGVEALGNASEYLEEECAIRDLRVLPSCLSPRSASRDANLQTENLGSMQEEDRDHFLVVVKRKRREQISPRFPHAPSKSLTSVFAMFTIALAATLVVFASARNVEDLVAKMDLTEKLVYM